MEKLVYVLWRPADQDPSVLARHLESETGPALLRDGVYGARYTVEAPEGSVLRVGTGPDGGLLGATVSVWLDSVDDRGWVEELLAGAPALSHGYLVTESIPIAYPPGVLDGVREGDPVPGLAITTVFDKNPDVSDQRFYDIWHGEHTPLSFDIHPLCLYVRNAVARSLTAGAPMLRAIVYEAVATADEMLDFHKFFGSGGDKDALRRNIERVNDHMATFADLSTLQTTPTRDFPLRVLST